MGKAGDQIDIDVRDPRRTEVGDVRQHRGSLVQSPHRRRLGIDERLHAQADAVHTAVQQSLQHLRRKRPRRTLHRHFGIRPHVKLRSHCVEHPPQLPGFEHRGRSTAEIDGVHFGLELPAHFCAQSAEHWRCRRTHDPHSGQIRPGKHVGCEVAVAALRPAERHGNVDSQSHRSDYPTRGRGRPRQHSTFSILPAASTIYLRYPVGGALNAAHPLVCELDR